MKRWATIGMAAVLATAGAVLAQPLPTSRSDLAYSFAPLVKRVSPAVVNIYTTTTARARRLPFPFPGMPQQEGQRVQNSVFECWVDAAQWVKLRANLVAEVAIQLDSLRFYFMGDNWKGRIEHLGAKPSYQPDEPLIL